MPVEDTPWFIGHEGVLHPAEVARSVAYAAANGSTGVVGRGDLKVGATGTPSNRVVIYPGAVNLVSGYAGATSQAYVGVIRSSAYATIEPTTSAGRRSDLVVARVRDPQYGDKLGFDPANPNNFDFFTIEVWKGVSATTKRILDPTYPAMALARIDIPASTATITQSMITDLREKSNRKTEIQVRTYFPAGDLNAPVSGYGNWPSNNLATFSVPLWATQAVIEVLIPGIEFTGSKRSTLGVRGAFGPLADGQNSIVVQTLPGRVMHAHISNFRLNSGFRGVDANYQLQAYHSSGNGSFQLDYQSILQYKATFTEGVE